MDDHRLRTWIEWYRFARRQLEFSHGNPGGECFAKPAIGVAEATLARGRRWAEVVDVVGRDPFVWQLGSEAVVEG